MNSWEKLRREERLIFANTWARRLWPFGLALVTFAWGFIVGVRRHEPADGAEQITQRALDKNADSLRLVRAAADSLAHVDTVASAIAVRSTAASTTHRPVVDSLAHRIHTGKVGDSVVVLERPTGGAHDSTQVDSLPTTTIDTLPLLVATFIREAKIQLVLDSTTIHDLTVSNDAKDVRIANLEAADALSQQRDSLHMEKEKQLEAQRNSAFRRGVTVGVKVVVGTAAVVGTMIKLARLVGK